jgi:hypothetical protein
MPKVLPVAVLLRDPLSKETRAERRTLLAASAIGIIIVKTGLVPSRISALGIEFNQTDQHSLLLATAAVILYFFAAFLIYAGSDLLLWRLTFHESVTQLMANTRRAMDTGLRTDEVRAYETLKTYSMHLTSGPVSILRGMFEFALPIIIGLYAMVLLIRARV